MKVSINRQIVEQRILMFFLLAFSGMPFFTHLGDMWLLGFFLVAVIRYLSIKKTIPNFYLLVLSLLVVLFVGQALKFNYFPIVTNVGLIVRWSLPLFVVLLLGKSFIQRFIEVSYFLCLFSFLIYFPIIIIPGFESFMLNNIAPLFQQTKEGFYNYNPNILIYTFNLRQFNYEMIRNSGPYWEPAAFAGYTIIALFLNLLQSKRALSKYNFVFTLAILTTLSTSGYLALLILSFSYFTIEKKSRFNWLPPLLVLFIGIYLISTNSIFYQKLKTAYEQTQSSVGEKSRRTRIVSAKVDLIDISKHPLFGKGRSEETRFGKSSKSYLEHRNNGVTDFTVKYGIPFAIFYFLFIQYSFRRVCVISGKSTRFAWAGLLIILIIGFSETYFQQSFFISLFYLHLNFPKL